MGLLVVGIAGGALAQRVGNARPRATAGAGTLDERMVAQAAVVAVEGVAEVRARVEGRVVSVLVREGERVTEGQLLAEIESGRLRPGDRVPSEKELAAQFHASRITSKKALEKLALEGIIERALALLAPEQKELHALLRALAEQKQALAGRVEAAEA